MAESRPRASRRDVVLLAVLCLFGLVRGMFSIATIETPSLIDEVQHLGYIESLAEGDGIPTVGKDTLSPELLGLVKATPTVLWRASPVSPDAGRELWGTTAEQYEGMQGPVYYALMVPPFWIGRALGDDVGALYAVRFATMLLALTAVPITWLIARRLFPARRLVATIAAGTMVVINGPIATSSAATNDSLMLPLGGLCVLAGLKVIRTPTARWLAIGGFVLGLALVAKSTAVTLLPAMAIVVVYALYRHREEGWRRVVAGLGAAAGGGAVAVVPWLAWNMATYGSPTASKEVEAILGRYQLDWPGGLKGVRLLVDGMRQQLWSVGGSTAGNSYRRFWEVVVVLVLAAGLTAVAVRAGRGPLLRVGWAAAGLPLGALAMIVLALFVFGGELSVAGRYLYPVFVLVAVAMGAGIEAIGGTRFALVLALVVGCGALFVERSFDRGYLEAFYEMDVYGDLAPVVEQSWGDGFVPMAQVEVDTGCSVTLFALRIEPRPTSLVVIGADGRLNASFVEDRPGFNYFRPDRAVASPLRIEVPAQSRVVVSIAERDRRTNSVGGIGDPVVRAYCAVNDPEATRFAQMYPPQHPQLSRRTILGWADARFVIGVLSLVVAVGLAVRRPQPDPPVR